MPMRKYEPNDRDREIVLRMAAIPNVTREAVAFCITNDRTGKAINRRTLEKHYAKELETAASVMQQITMKSFVEQILEHSWPATRLALANYCGLKDGAEVSANVSVNNNLKAELHGIRVEFCGADPDKWKNDPLPAGPYDPRPISRKEMYDAANVTHPHRIEHDANELRPVPDPARHAPPPPDPVATPTNLKERRAAIAERGQLEGWQPPNPRQSVFGGGPFNPNRPSKNGKFI
jgi:hypothetical protein